MKWLILIASSLIFCACTEQGPPVPTCFIMEDLVTEYCVPFKKGDQDFKRAVKAGDYAFTPNERGVVQRWIERHRNKK